MKKKLSLIMLSLLASGLLLFSGCKESPTEQVQAQETNVKTTDVGIYADMGKFGQNGPQDKVTGDIERIDSMEVTVKDVSTDAVYKDKIPMTFASGKWSILLKDLPVGSNLSFSIDAYEQDYDSTADRNTYSGVTYKTLQGGDNLNIPLVSTENKDVLTIPQLYSVEAVENIEVDVTTDVTLLIRGRENTKIYYRISSPETGGRFLSREGSIQLTGNAASLVLSYIAPVSSLGTHKHEIELIDETGNRITTAFKTTVVMGADSPSGVVAQFAPRIKYVELKPEYLTGHPSGDVRIQFYLDEDKMEYNDISGRLVFEDDTTTDAITLNTRYCYYFGCEFSISNYTPEMKGWLRFSVTDGDGLSTSTSVYLPENLFPHPNE